MGLDIEGRDIVAYIPLLVSLGLTFYAVWQSLQPRNGLVNPSIRKSEAVVVNSMNIEDIGDGIAFCRCWRSQKFPLCDGSHSMYNKKTGDNAGPMCLKRKNK